MVKKKKAVISRAEWDWKADDNDILNSLEEALEPFGVFVQQSPACYGTDGFGFVFANEDISESEAEDWEEKEDDD